MKRLSNAARASLGVRGAGICRDAEPFWPVAAASRATVIRRVFYGTYHYGLQTLLMMLQSIISLVIVALLAIF